VGLVLDGDDPGKSGTALDRCGLADSLVEKEKAMNVRRGHTLIEFLVVAAIIAILLAVFVPLTRSIPAPYYFTRPGLVRSVSYSPNGAGGATCNLSVFSNQRDWSYTGQTKLLDHEFQAPFLPGDTVRLTYLKKDMTDPEVVQVEPQ
jgi:prepilin-type N-terminal cleavage/methylation domain-containing protein